MTKQRRLVVRWPIVAAAVLALGGVVLTTAPAEDVSAAPTGVEDTARSQVTTPVRPASLGRRLGGTNPGRTGPLVLGLTIADLGDPSAAAAPAAPAARIPALPRITTTAKPGTAAAAAIAFALAQRGLPYIWGGDGPQLGEAGFDCSGLTTAAFDWAGISLPRTAHTQYYAGPHVPADAPLEPGDLVFYGTPERVHHVGLHIGNGRMINAPTFGRPVRIAYVRYPGDDYLGATRPAAGRDAPGLLDVPDLPFDVPPVPAPGAPPGPAEFPAPPAPEDPPASPAPEAQATVPRAGSGVVPAPGTSILAAPDASASQLPSTSPAPAAGTAGPTSAAGNAGAVTQGNERSATTPGGTTSSPPPAASPPGAGTATPSTASTPAPPTTGDAARASARPPAGPSSTVAPATSGAAADTPSAQASGPPRDTSTPGAAAGTPPAQASSPPRDTSGAGAPTTSSAPAQATTAPSATRDTDTTTTRPRETDARTTSPSRAGAPAQTTTEAGSEGSGASSSDVALPPNTIRLPSGETLTLVNAQAGGGGLASAPTGAGTAAVRRSGGTTVITLPPTAGTVGLSLGGTVQLTDADGDPAEFDVEGARTVDADTAADTAASGSNRLILLQPRDDGEVLMVVAN